MAQRHGGDGGISQFPEGRMTPRSADGRRLHRAPCPCGRFLHQQEPWSAYAPAPVFQVARHALKTQPVNRDLDAGLVGSRGFRFFEKAPGVPEANRGTSGTEQSGLAMNELGKLLVMVGLLLTAVGVLLWTGWDRGWLGRLPGDIHYTRGNFSFHFPIVTCLLLSAVLTLLLWLFRK